jgi:hypothetical protein
VLLEKGCNSYWLQEPHVGHYKYESQEHVLIAQDCIFEQPAQSDGNIECEHGNEATETGYDIGSDADCCD